MWAWKNIINLVLPDAMFETSKDQWKSCWALVGEISSLLHLISPCHCGSSFYEPWQSVVWHALSETYWQFYRLWVYCSIRQIAFSRQTRKYSQINYNLYMWWCNISSGLWHYYIRHNFLRAQNNILLLEFESVLGVFLQIYIDTRQSSRLGPHA